MQTIRVAVLVSNSLAGDSRVEKIATSLTHLPAEVKVFGLGSTRFPVDTRKDTYSIYRPPNAITKVVKKSRSTNGRVPFKLRVYRLVKKLMNLKNLKQQIKSFLLARDTVFKKHMPADETIHQWKIDSLAFSWHSELIRWSPQIIHANDADTLGIAVNATEELRRKGKNCKVVYDQHEYLPEIFRQDPTWREFMLDQENKYIRKVQAVTSVSDFMVKDLSDRYQLKVPTVAIINAPTSISPPVDPKIQTVRAVLGLSSEIPLHVYVGVAAAARGVHTIVEALQYAPGHHFAIITGTKNHYVDLLSETARQLNVQDRFHVLPYVSAEYVSTFISDASSGVSPLLKFGAHEVSLGTKFYEYVFAGLPVLTSDVKVQAEVTARHSLGEVFIAEDPVSAARAMIKIATAERSVYTRDHSIVKQKWSWENQSIALLEIYRCIME